MKRICLITNATWWINVPTWQYNLKISLTMTSLQSVINEKLQVLMLWGKVQQGLLKMVNLRRTANKCLIYMVEGAFAKSKLAESQEPAQKGSAWKRSKKGSKKARICTHQNTAKDCQLAHMPTACTPLVKNLIDWIKKNWINNLKYEMTLRQHMHRNMNFTNKFEKSAMDRKEKWSLAGLCKL